MQRSETRYTDSGLHHTNRMVQHEIRTGKRTFFPAYDVVDPGNVAVNDPTVGAIQSAGGFSSTGTSTFGDDLYAQAGLDVGGEFLVLGQSDGWQPAAGLDTAAFTGTTGATAVAGSTTMARSSLASARLESNQNAAASNTPVASFGVSVQAITRTPVPLPPLNVGDIFPSQVRVHFNSLMFNDQPSMYEVVEGGIKVLEDGCYLASVRIVMSNSSTPQGDPESRRIRCQVTDGTSLFQAVDKRAYCSVNSPPLVVRNSTDNWENGGSQVVPMQAGDVFSVFVSILSPAGTTGETLNPPGQSPPAESTLSLTRVC